MIVLTRKRLAALAATTALVGGGVAMAPAAAAVPAASAVMASGGTAPACIHRNVFEVLQYVKISNHCGKTMQVKVVINYGPDSSCYRMKNKSSFGYYWAYGRYGKTVVC
ncbi:beta-Ig-H3/fasciclin [Streptomyces griseofuscus]|uniref:beta-Ig-H3/fasciclin n=1 Tax=Streptomyces griseofuscus TaxID=146922 RepID=UPI003819C7DD